MFSNYNPSISKKKKLNERIRFIKESERVHLKKKKYEHGSGRIHFYYERSENCIIHMLL